jgi:hypothetical protein
MTIAPMESWDAVETVTRIRKGEVSALEVLHRLADCDSFTPPDRRAAPDSEDDDGRREQRAR